MGHGGLFFNHCSRRFYSLNIDPHSRRNNTLSMSIVPGYCSLSPGVSLTQYPPSLSPSPNYSLNVNYPRTPPLYPATPPPNVDYSGTPSPNVNYPNTPSPLNGNYPNTPSPLNGNYPRTPPKSAYPGSPPSTALFPGTPPPNGRYHMSPPSPSRDYRGTPSPNGNLGNYHEPSSPSRNYRGTPSPKLNYSLAVTSGSGKTLTACIQSMPSPSMSSISSPILTSVISTPIHSPTFRVPSPATSPPFRVSSPASSAQYHTPSGEPSPPIRTSSAESFPPVRKSSQDISPPFRIQTPENSPQFPLTMRETSSPFRRTSQDISPPIRSLSQDISPPIRSLSQDIKPPFLMPASEHSQPLIHKLGGGNSIDSELCRICGDRASGYHYNALSCEGCKGFFRRSITRSAGYKCKDGGACEMDMWMRRKCQACRLRRCREVGMKEECLLSDAQCKARDARRKAKVRRTKDTSPIPQCSTQNGVIHPLRVQFDDMPELYFAKLCYTDKVMSLISSEHRELVQTLIFLQEKYELPSEKDIANATVIDPDSVDKNVTVEVFWMQLAEFTALVTQLVVNFAKRLPGFGSLTQEDQIVLLKASTCDVMTIRSAQRYDKETRSIVMANNVPLTCEIMRGLGMGQFANLTFDFCHSMAVMGVDNAEFALLTAISIFSERPGLHHPRRVERVLEIYTDALKDYINVKHKAVSSSFFGKLLWKLTDMRSISAEHAKMILNVNFDSTTVPQLLSEVFTFRDTAIQNGEDS